MSESWRILLIDDDEDDFILTQEMISNARGGRVVLEWAPTYEDALQQEDIDAMDAILVDYHLGPNSGLELVQELQARGCRVPIILMTGRGSYAVDIEAMKAGVMDYLLKSEVSGPLLERTIRYAIERKQTEEQLRQAKDELELRVQERTQELVQTNRALRAEIEERKQIQAELGELRRRLMDSIEAERILLAQELHDGPMQDLYGLTYRIAALENSALENPDNEDLKTMQSRVTEVIQTLRGIAGDLRPPALAPFGLEKAIRDHVSNFQKDHPDLDIHLALMSDGTSLPEPVRMALFRIYQIAITNVIRHAEATRAEIRLILDESQVVMEIEDNGVGFEVPDRWIGFARQGHLGLVGATERAEAAGGRLEVESQLGRGTVIRVIVPRQGLSG